MDSAATRDERLVEARTAFARADWQGASELYELVLDSEADDPEALDGLGQSRWWLGDAQAGIELRAAVGSGGHRSIAAARCPARGRTEVFRAALARPPLAQGARDVDDAAGRARRARARSPGVTRRAHPGARDSRPRSLPGSGRVGRTAAAKALDAGAIDLAVAASIRHEDTPYDELLMTGLDRGPARERVRVRVTEVLEEWRGG